MRMNLFLINVMLPYELLHSRALLEVVVLLITKFYRTKNVPRHELFSFSWLMPDSKIIFPRNVIITLL